MMPRTSGRGIIPVIMSSKSPNEEAPKMKRAVYVRGEHKLAA